ncbi:Hypothetical predicted protein, partial [Lecanosticta acicola]
LQLHHPSSGIAGCRACRQWPSGRGAARAVQSSRLTESAFVFSPAAVRCEPMAPQVPALAQSDSKSRFQGRLGMSTKNPRDKRVYAAMKREATKGRKRLIDRYDPDATISETDMHGEILRIYEQASPQTKPTYDLGRDQDGIEEENWIIRWMLWHAFRYRDQRNNRIRNQASSTVGDLVRGDDSENGFSSPNSVSKEMGGSATAAECLTAPRDRFYDPVRDST